MTDAPPRNFCPGSLHMVTYRLRRSVAQYVATGCWTIGGAYVPEHKIQDIGPKLEPPRVHPARHIKLEPDQ